MRNKKAGERVLSIYLFIIYIIVAAGIVSGVIIFYGHPLDARAVEAEVLTDKVIDCLTEQGELNKDIFNKDVILEELCNFDFRDNTRKYLGEERYAVKVELYDFNNNGLRKIFFSGDNSFFEICNKGDKTAICDEKQVYILFGQTKFILKINSAIGKVENA